jgi:hypothetical protein
MTIIPNLSRRQLLSTAATVSAAGVAPNVGFEAHKELRRMKEAADAGKFRNFAEAHRRRAYQKMLARVRRQCGNPHWAPTGMLSGGGLWFGAQVDEQLTKLYCWLSEGRPAG